MLLVTALLAGCSKAPPKRAKRAHHGAPGGASGIEDQAPGAAAPPTAQPTPMAVRVPDLPPPPPQRRALSVDTNPTPPPPEPPHRRAARVATTRPLAAAPTPAPAPRPVDDKARGTTCETGSGHGELLSVTGVAADDVLNVREAPDRTSAVLGGLPPDTTGVRGTSNRKRVGGSSWREIECGKIRGWVNERFLSTLARGAGN